MKKEVKDNYKKSLMEFLDEDSLPIEDGSVIEPEKINDSVPFDLDEKKKKSANKARKLVTSMFKLLSEDMVIERSEYLQAKKRIDAMSLYQIFMSIEQLDHVIKTLVDSIDGGNQNSRIFEVFGNLQRTKLDMIKEGALIIMQMEDSVKRLTQDFKQKLYESGAVSETKETNSTAYRGAKDLMRQIKNNSQISETNKKDTETDETIISQD